VVLNPVINKESADARLFNRGGSRFDLQPRRGTLTNPSVGTTFLPPSVSQSRLAAIAKDAMDAEPVGIRARRPSTMAVLALNHVAAREQARSEAPRRESKTSRRRITVESWDEDEDECKVVEANHKKDSVGKGDGCKQTLPKLIHVVEAAQHGKPSVTEDGPANQQRVSGGTRGSKPRVKSRWERLTTTPLNVLIT
jgi:hypothetical protein